MLTRIELTNFMSHRHTVIEPGPGLTVLVGPNNCGKSAVAAALQILCTNENSTYVVRHGARDCQILVTTDDGNEVAWRRQKAPSYTINGQKFDRLGMGGLPAELHQALRLPKVDAGNNTDFDVHFGLQKSPIFLLGSTGSHAAKFFAASSDVIRLVEIQKRHKDKLSDSKKEKKDLEKKSKQLNAELELLKPAVELDRRLEVAEGLHDQITREQTLLAGAELHLRHWSDQSRQFEQQSQRQQVLGKLPSPPQLADTDGLADRVECLAVTMEKRAACEQLQGVLARVLPPPALHDVEHLERCVARLASLDVEVQKGTGQATVLAKLSTPPTMADAASLEAHIRKQQVAHIEGRRSASHLAALQPLAPPPALVEVAALEATIEHIQRSQQQFRQLEARGNAIANLDEPPEVVLPAPLDQLIGALAKWTRDVAAGEAALKRLEAELAKTEQAIREIASSSNCPTCGAPLDADRLLAQGGFPGGHAHD